MTVSTAMLNPCQSLLHDLVEDTDLGFSVYSFALSLGGFFGYLLSAVDWTGTALGRAGQERAVFLLLLLAMGACLAITLVLAKEKPLASPKGIGGVANEKAVPSPPFSSLAVHDEGFKKGGKWAPTEFNSVKLTSLEPGPTTPKHDPPSKDVVIFSNRISSSETKSLQDKQLGSPPFADGVGACKFLQCVFGLLPAQAVASLRHIPSSLWRLFFFMLLAWMALMSHFLYFSDFTAEVVYHGLPEDSAAKADRLRYDRGIRAASWGLLVNCVAASVYAIGLQCRITERFGQRTGLQLGMGTFAIAMCYLLVLNDFTSILVLSAVMGIAAAAIESIPFALTCFYCENRQEYFKESQHTFGVGQCLALLTTAEYLSQVILTLLMGYVFSATRTPASYVLFAMVSALASVGASAFLVCPPPTAPKKSID
ncbi:solute carrier family 45 member 3-like [Haemaphysalis longicornis]